MKRSAASLGTISEPVRPHLGAFDDVFNSSIRSNIPLVDLVAKYVIRRKGKKVRPILVLLSAGLCGTINERSYRGAALVEILHSATLIHDDVIDEADTRRGFPSINAIWKNKISILMGDYLLARGLLLCLDNDEFRFLKITSTSVKRMSEGEIHQIQKSRRLDIDEPTYFRIIGDKTASLLATCCEIGAASVTDDRTVHEQLRAYGENVGMAFQIRDDLLDYIGRTRITGKPTGLDLSDRKLTLPLIHALEKGDRKEGKKVIDLVKNGKKIRSSEVEQVRSFVERNGGLEYAASRARGFADEAVRLLDSFPDSDCRQALLQFAEFVISREK